MVFLTGQEEIETACKMIKQSEKAHKNNPQINKIIPFPLYATLHANAQASVFEPVPLVFFSHK